MTLTFVNNYYFTKIKSIFYKIKKDKKEKNNTK